MDTIKAIKTDIFNKVNNTFKSVTDKDEYTKARSNFWNWCNLGIEKMKSSKLFTYDEIKDITNYAFDTEAKRAKEAFDRMQANARKNFKF